MNQRSIFNIKVAIAIIIIAILYIAPQIVLGCISKEAHKEVQRNEELTSYFSTTE